MKKILILSFFLLTGVLASAQHPVSPERQMKIRQVAAPIWADTLKNVASRSIASFSKTSGYGESELHVSAYAKMEYAVRDDLIWLKWPVRVSASYGPAAGKASVKYMDYSDLTLQCNYTKECMKDPLLKWLLYAGGYRIKEEIVFPQAVYSGGDRETGNEEMKPEGSLREWAEKYLPLHNRKAEKSGRIWEITAFEAHSLTLRAAVPGGGPATLQRAWEADPYALVFALALDMGIRFYLYDSGQIAPPQEAFFRAEDIVNAVK